MSSFYICFIPVNSLDLPGLEQWLEQMAAKGLRFSFTCGPLAFFDRVEPAPLLLHLEPARKAANSEDKDLSELYAAQGWSYVGVFRNTFYIYSTDDPQAQAHTDPEIQSYSIAWLTRRIRFQLWGLTALLFFLCYLIYDRFSSIWFWDLRLFPLDTLMTHELPLWLLPLPFALILLMLSKFLALRPLYRVGNALDRGEPMARPNKLKGGGWLKGFFLTLLLVPLFFAFQVRYEKPIPLDEFSSQGYVRLAELETAPSFRTQREARDNVYYHRQLLIPRQYNSSEWGRYLGEDLIGSDSHGSIHVESDTGTTLSSSWTPYYLNIQYLHCLTQGIADAMMEEQSGWHYFAYGTETVYPGFDRLILFHEEEGSLGLTRWLLYGQRGQDLLLVDYQGRGDFEAFLPRFAQMIRSL